MLRLATLATAVLALLACGDDGGSAVIDAGPADDAADPAIDAALPPGPDAATAACTPTSGTTTADLRLEQVVTGLVGPTFVTAPPGDKRLFVLEQPGRIRLVVDGALVATPYLDISDRVENGDNEEGLLGMAFHPGWAQNGKFYVNYIRDVPGEAYDETVIAEFQTTAVDAETAAPATERVLMTIKQDSGNHNGGMINFGPDGYLYIGMGDGGGSGDKPNRAQDPTGHLGSMLRINVDDVTGGAYGIPSDNPFADGNGGAAEVFAYGLRNPWRWSFDRMTGDAYIADVGQNRVEEVNVLSGAAMLGANFGWNEWEGTECFNSAGDYDDEGAGCTLAGVVDPVAEYGHTGGGLTPLPDDPAGNSITGGYVYRGPCLPGVQGSYVYGDFETEIIRTFTWDGTQNAQTEVTLTPGIRDGLPVNGIASFGEDGFGELYLVSAINGVLYRIVDPQ